MNLKLQSKFQPRHYPMNKIQTLIIDDESDQASINTNKIDQDPTAINSHIRNLLRCDEDRALRFIELWNVI